jgi:UDP:flavonoid glycosyltransferase YjiC (YdhE family)
MGGVRPFVTKGTYIAENVTVVGSLKSTAPVDISRLDDWITRSSAGKNIIYACFGTGTMLDCEEVKNLARLVLALKDTKYRVLLAVRKEEQDRYQQIFDKMFGLKPSFTADGVLEYGTFRIDDNVPQESLLQSGKVRLFISHMGFGGYTEAINGGVPIVAYPSGCDQWYNAERAIEAGVAVKAHPKLSNLDSTVIKILEEKTFQMRSMQLASEAKMFASDEIILDHLEGVISGGNTDSETASTCSNTATARLIGERRHSNSKT